MMPTFPRSPLSFRTAGFPRYGWKAGMSGGAFPAITSLSLLPAFAGRFGLRPPFVHLVVASVIPHCVGPRTRSCTALEGGSPSAPGALALVRVMLSRPVITYSAPSAPPAGTSRFHRMAAYTRCLRCAGAPRRPASGSGLSLHIPSWHAALSDPGEFDHRFFPDNDVGMAFAEIRPARHSRRSRNPFHAGHVFGATGFTHLLRPVRLLAPLYGSDQLPANGGFYFQAFNGSVALPVAGYDYSSDWTPCMGLFLSRSFNQHGPSFFLRFFVRSESSFLRPDPPQWQAVARRSCQGWSPLRRPAAGLGP